MPLVIDNVVALTWEVNSPEGRAFWENLASLDVLGWSSQAANSDGKMIGLLAASDLDKILAHAATYGLETVDVREPKEEPWEPEEGPEGGPLDWL